MQIFFHFGFRGKFKRQNDRDEKKKKNHFDLQQTESDREINT